MMPFYPQALAEPRTHKVSLWEHLFLTPHYILEASIYISWEDKTLELPSIINPQPTGSSHILCERLRLNFLPPFQFKTLNRLFEYFFSRIKWNATPLPNISCQWKASSCRWIGFLTVPRIPDILASLLGADLKNSHETHKHKQQTASAGEQRSALAAYTTLLRRLWKYQGEAPPRTY